MSVLDRFRTLPSPHPCRVPPPPVAGFPADTREESDHGVTLTAAISIVGAALASSGVVLSQTWSGAPSTTSIPRVDTTTTAQLPLEEIVVCAASRAALVRLCLDELGDPVAHDRFQAATAANPSSAEGIGPTVGRTARCRRRRQP